jgi:hypothetical protein
MPYLTEHKLASIMDLPVSLSSTEIRQGDWLLIATVKIVQPMALIVRYLNIQLLSSNIDVARVSNSNKIYGNLGLAYVALRLNYTGGSPGLPGATETLVATDLGITARDVSTPLIISVPGTYSWVVANNMAADTSSLIPASTSIDFKLSVTGQVRLDLSNA